LVSSVAATVLIGLILWPAAASGEHLSSSAGVVPPLAGDLDSSFGSAGVVSHSPGFLGAIAVQPDGKVVVAATAGSYSGFLLARYLPDGSPDPTFGNGGYVETQVGEEAAGGGSATAVALEPDGRIVVAGVSDQGLAPYPGSSGIEDEFAVARYNPDGSLDPSFGTGGITSTVIPQPLSVVWDAGAEALAILSDGDIVVGGWAGFSSFPDTSDFALVEYKPNGALDPVFGQGGIVQTAFTAESSLSSLAVQPDGDIVAGGSNVAASHGDDTYEMAVARYAPNGSLDPTFGTNGQVQTAEKLRYQGGPSTLQGGKIVVAGFRTNDHGFARFPVLARFGAGGNLDPSFGNHGYEEIRSLKHDAAEAVATQPDGKILVATNSAVARLLPNGRLDPNFGRQGTATLAGAINLACPTPEIDLCGDSTRLALQPDGNVLVGGTADPEDQSNSTLRLARLIGGNNCVIPTLRGKTIPKARAQLKASYCRTGGISKLFSNRIARGHVISTTPLPDDRRPADTKVGLLVSRGKHTHRS
jgi:uncharacterized delta-60 repeat protein